MQAKKPIIKDVAGLNFELEETVYLPRLIEDSAEKKRKSPY